MVDKLRLAVFVSGGGTNLQALLDACRDRDFPAEVVVVVSNKSGAYGLTRAEQAGIPTVLVPHLDFSGRSAHEVQILKEIAPHEPQAAALAGYMRVVTPTLLDHFYSPSAGLPGVINIHPADTLAYQGAHGYEFAMGLLPGTERLRETKITVHFVDAGVDTGPIIEQAPVPVLPEDSLDDLRARGLKVEHRLYPQVLRQLAQGRLSLTAEGLVEIA